MCKTFVEAVNAKDATKKKEFANKKRPRGSPCCHFGKIKFTKYIAIAIFDI